jgi:hypothetical protein
LDGTISLGGKDVNKIWRPDTYFNNNNDYELRPENQLALISKYGEVYFSARYAGISCFRRRIYTFPAYSMISIFLPSNQDVGESVVSNVSSKLPQGRAEMLSCLGKL